MKHAIKTFHLSNGNTARSKHLTVHTTIEGFLSMARSAGAIMHFTAEDIVDRPEYNWGFSTKILNKIEKMLKDELV